MRRRYGKRRGSFRGRRRMFTRGVGRRRGFRRRARGRMRTPRPGRIGYRL